jgi:rRNA processing protein Gar1
VRCEEGVEPTFDTAVYDSSLDRVGDVFEFFGPVERPYALVDGDAPRDTKLYLRD